MSKRKGKLIEVESDEEEIYSYPHLFGGTLLGPQIPPGDVGPSLTKEILGHPPLEVTPSPSGREPNADSGGQSSGSGESRGSDGVESHEESSPEMSRPVKKMNLGHRIEVDSYPIDFLKCITTPTNLFKLRNLYHIPNDVELVIPGKGDVPSRPPSGYVTLHLECFKLGVRLPLQSYFAKVLSGLHLAPGQLHPNGWRVLSGMFVLWARCGLGKPTTEEIKNLYQLKNSLKDAGWYYFMSSSAKRKPITCFSSSCKN